MLLDAALIPARAIVCKPRRPTRHRNGSCVSPWAGTGTAHVDALRQLQSPGVNQSRADGPFAIARRGRRAVVAPSLIGTGVLAIAAAWPDVMRSGYSPDEEFTLVAVRGIEAHGLPLLPSGLLYDRGLAYSYGSWLAGLAAGQSLPVFRATSLACGVLSLWVLFRELRRMTSVAGAALAVVAAAASLPFWVSATTARFYAPFLLCYLATLALLARYLAEGETYWKMLMK